MIPLLVASLAVAGTPDAGTVAERLRDEALAHSMAHIWVGELVDAAGPRLAGGPGDAPAVARAVQKMKSLGLSHVHTEAVTAPHWERGEQAGRLIQPRPQALSLAALGGSIGTSPEGIEAAVVLFPTMEALAKAPADAVRGKIAFINQHMERTRSGEGYSAAVKMRYAGPSEAAKRGALAVVIRSVTPSSQRFPHTGGTDPTSRIPAAALATPDADLLARMLEAGESVVLHLTLGCKNLPEVQTYNVVGEVPGRAHPEEVVLFGAHLDSWDLGMGALDDGAGVGVVLEAARLIARHGAPERTVRVVLFANEENGLAGGKGYAKLHAAEVEHHLLASEIDLGTSRAYALSYRGSKEATVSMQALMPLLRPLGIAEATFGGWEGSDIGPLRAAGVPVMDLKQDATTYFDIHHTADDTYDKVDPAGLAQLTAALVAVGWEVADSALAFGRVQ